MCGAPNLLCVGVPNDKQTPSYKKWVAQSCTTVDADGQRGGLFQVGRRRVT